ncbi:hypothetical protein ACFQ09_20030 [Massilia norwichensis]|uniref:Restriction endonuclease type IV Mrr domain-containing protein n=1 Tax=Massilia norwichensis TaxID=1442366 RepID=A0ABT2A2E7_9BURK|nr:hypothetical protein [Massilia norwichensis]MCS0588353.1 hypothetical protein [Massilia norwichensis]
MQLYQTRIPAPKDWQQLQRIANDFYKNLYKDSSVDEYGTNGQAQDGVDVYVYGGATAVAVQCKCVEEFSPAELRNEFNKTETFNNRIDLYILVVTVPRDTKLTDEAAKLTRENARNIRIEVKFWQSMAEEMASVDELAKKYLGFVARYPVLVEGAGASAHITLETETSCFKFVVTHMASISDIKSYGKDLLLVTSLQANKSACFHNLGGGHWSDFDGVIGCTKLDAFAAWIWFSRFRDFDELMKTSGQGQSILITDRQLNEIRRLS